MSDYKRYQIVHMWKSLQGEGARTGTANVFVRFSKCNLQCTLANMGFDCDTEFEAVNHRLTKEQLHEECYRLGSDTGWIIFTGGEPALQLDMELCEYLRDQGWKLAVETNGTMLLPYGGSEATMQAALDGKVNFEAMLQLFPFDWIVVSPKYEAVKQLWCHEVRYVLEEGEAVPSLKGTGIQASVGYLSPAYDGDEEQRAAIDWVARLCLANPEWRLSTQDHKTWRVE
jgi:organic radical activating enzyme